MTKQDQDAKAAFDSLMSKVAQPAAEQPDTSTPKAKAKRAKVASKAKPEPAQRAYNPADHTDAISTFPKRKAPYGYMVPGTADWSQHPDIRSARAVTGANIRSIVAYATPLTPGYILASVGAIEHTRGTDLYHAGRRREASALAYNKQAAKSGMPILILETKAIPLVAAAARHCAENAHVTPTTPAWRSFMAKQRYTAFIEQGIKPAKAKALTAQAIEQTPKNVGYMLNMANMLSTEQLTLLDDPRYSQQYTSVSKALEKRISALRSPKVNAAGKVLRPAYFPQRGYVSLAMLDSVAPEGFADSWLAGNDKLVTSAVERVKAGKKAPSDKPAPKPRQLMPFLVNAGPMAISAASTLWERYCGAKGKPTAQNMRAFWGCIAVGGKDDAEAELVTISTLSPHHAEGYLACLDQCIVHDAKTVAADEEQQDEAA